MDINIVPVIKDAKIAYQYMIGTKIFTEFDFNIINFIYRNILPFIYDTKKGIYFGDAIFKGKVNTDFDNISIYIKHNNQIFEIIITKQHDKCIPITEFEVDGNTFVIDIVGITEACRNIVPKRYQSYISVENIKDYITRIFDKFFSVILIKKINMDFEESSYLNVFVTTLLIVRDYAVSIKQCLTKMEINPTTNCPTFNKFKNVHDISYYYQSILFLINFIVPNLKLDGVSFEKIQNIEHCGNGVYGFGLLIKTQNKQIFVKIEMISKDDDEFSEHASGELSALIKIGRKDLTGEITPMYYGSVFGHQKLTTKYNETILLTNGMEISMTGIIDNISHITKMDRISIENLNGFIKMLYKNVIVIFTTYADGNLVDIIKSLKRKEYDTSLIMAIIIHDLVISIDKIHKLCICHMDLKIDNVVYYKNLNKIKCLLIDFGLSGPLYSSSLLGSFRQDETSYDFYKVFGDAEFVSFFSDLGYNGYTLRNELYEWVCLGYIILHILGLHIFSYFEHSQIKAGTFELHQTMPHYDIISNNTILSDKQIEIVHSMINVIIFLFGFSKYGIGIKICYGRYSDYLTNIVKEFDIKNDDEKSSIFNRLVNIELELFKQLNIS